MSNRRKLRPRRDPGWLNDALAPLDGARIPGGCDTCDAYQVITATAHGQRALSFIEVHHDDWCPTYLAMQTAKENP